MMYKKCALLTLAFSRCAAGDYIRADGSTEIGRLMKGMDWGDATSNPASVHDGLCQA